MNAASRSLHHSISASSSQHKKSIGRSEMSFRKSSGSVSPEDAEREWFAGLLWAAFPEATSENHLADLASQVLRSEKRPCTPRTVRNWLRCENTPHFRYVLRVIALAGAEQVFQMIDPEVGQ